MLDIDKLRAVKKCIVHDNCPDGLASAILLKDAYFGQDVAIEFVQYGTGKHKKLVAEPGMLFADFTPPPDRVQEFVDAGAIVIDHHTQQRDITEAFGASGIFGDEASQPGIAGATLVFEHVWLPFRHDLAVQRTFAEHFARIAGVRDTWQKKSPDWIESCKQAHILKFYPRERLLAMTLTDLAAKWRSPQFADLGDILWDKQQRTTKKIIGKSYRFTTTRGTRVVAFSGSGQTSDVADEIDADADLVVGFDFEVEDGQIKMIFSTRSHTTFDCGTFCKSFVGGGGHTKAAGFNRPIDPKVSLNPYGFVEALVEAWEGKGSMKTGDTQEVHSTTAG
jgi:oligoribonuclease NrnB/cAMP/cGMP phosphodiesterase (DHH superfamily)